MACTAPVVVAATELMNGCKRTINEQQSDISTVQTTKHGSQGRFSVAAVDKHDNAMQTHRHLLPWWNAVTNYCHWLRCIHSNRNLIHIWGCVLPIPQLRFLSIFPFSSFSVRLLCCTLASLQLCMGLRRHISSPAGSPTPEMCRHLPTSMVYNSENMQKLYATCTKRPTLEK